MIGNYRSLYKSTEKVLKIYQNQIVPELKRQIEELKQQNHVVRCKDCKWRNTQGCIYTRNPAVSREDHDYCSDGEKKEE